jgi:hypothetical protein
VRGECLTRSSSSFARYCARRHVAAPVVLVGLRETPSLWIFGSPYSLGGLESRGRSRFPRRSSNSHVLNSSFFRFNNKPLCWYWLPGPHPTLTFPTASAEQCLDRLAPFISNRFLALSLIALMMEAVRTSETFVNLHQSTRRYGPADSHFIHTAARTSNHT